MKTYTFRLVVTDRIDDDGANRLFEAGVEDGVPESGPQGHSIGFDRESSSLQEAILSAIAEVESAGFDVLRVEPDDVVSAADIAERTGRSRQSVSSLINGTRGPGGWPRPVAGNVRSPLWRWSDIGAGSRRSTGRRRSTRTKQPSCPRSMRYSRRDRALRPLGAQARKRLLRQLAS